MPLAEDRRPYVHKEVQKMAKLTGNYEVLYVINPTLGEEETAALVARFK